MSKATKFAEWLAENHYKLCNVSKDNHYWISESDEDREQTTEQLEEKFNNHKHIWNGDVCKICLTMKFG